jgi:hypothetical protein
MKIKNVSKSTRGIALPTGFYKLRPQEEVHVSQHDLDRMLQVGRFKVLVDVGTLKILPGGEPAPVVEEEAEPEGVEIRHAGGGWYEVIVNGIAVTDEKVRKEQAVAVAADCER